MSVDLIGEKNHVISELDNNGSISHENAVTKENTIPGQYTLENVTKNKNKV